MDLAQIMTFIDALGDTWFGDVFYGFSSALFIIALSKLIVPFFKYIQYTNLIRNLEKYMEFSLLRDFPEYVKTEKSAKWLEKVRLWFIRNS